jgi:hypothetical protein
MRKMIDYCIVKASSPNNIFGLEEPIKKLIVDGWEILGDLRVDYEADSNGVLHMVYVREMVKYEED